MNFRIVLEYDADAQAFSAVCPELPGCAPAGDTEEEAKQNIKEAIRTLPGAVGSGAFAQREGGRGDRWVTAEHPVSLPSRSRLFLKRHGFALMGQSGSHQKVAEPGDIETGDCRAT